MNTALLRPLLGAAIGAAVGFAMYKLVGCRSGACPLTGNPWISVILWGVIGAMVSLSPR
jgi:hypothetical protein